MARRPAFTAKDVVCTFDLLTGKGEQKLRRNPRQSWYGNVESVTANSDDEVTIHLKRPQPSILSLLASGYSPIYPCHVPAAQMRTKPVGTGPFKFVEFKQNEGIKIAQESRLLEEGPALSRRHRVHHRAQPLDGDPELRLGPLRHHLPLGGDDPAAQGHQEPVPNAVCEVTSMNNSTNLIVNRDAPPFDNPELRKALVLALDRKAFIDILNQGNAEVGGTMQPPKDGVWGLPADQLASVPGYGSDVEKNRAEARAIMQKLGYGPDKRLKIKVATRGISLYKDPAVILLGQLKEIYIDAELEIIDTSQWFTRVARKDYTVGLNTTGNGVDDPDQNFFENFSCKSERNYTGYCNPEIEKLFEVQSAETDIDKRQEARLGDRPQAAGGRRAADHHVEPRGDLHAALRQGLRAAGQQRLQRLPLRGRLARQVTLALSAAGGCPRRGSARRRAGRSRTAAGDTGRLPPPAAWRRPGSRDSRSSRRGRCAGRRGRRRPRRRALRSSIISGRTTSRTRSPVATPDAKATRTPSISTSPAETTRPSRRLVRPMKWATNSVAGR